MSHILQNKYDCVLLTKQSMLINKVNGKRMMNSYHLVSHCDGLDWLVDNGSLCVLGCDELLEMVLAVQITTVLGVVVKSGIIE